MRRALMLAVSCALLAAWSPAQDVGGVRSPAYSEDGRLAVSIAGSLWVLEPDDDGGWASARQVTFGPAWDRDPAWTPDGTALVFSSDRAGGIDLWRVELATSGEDAPVVRLTTSREHDLDPHVGPDGAIVFARGLGGDADLWVLGVDGTERRLTEESGAEREPAWSPDGGRIAYVAMRGSASELRVMHVDGAGTAAIVTGRQARRPVWSPDGARLAYAVTGQDGATWVVDADGGSSQTAAAMAGAPAWSPDGQWLLLASLDGGDGGYNGDPDRLGERLAGDIIGASGGLHRVPAPVPPPAAVTVTLPVVDDAEARAGRNVAAYDRVWTRVARLYYGLADGPGLDAEPGAAEGEGLAAWRRVGLKHRDGAVRAADDAGVEDAIGAMLAERPVGQGAVGRAGVSSAHPLASEAGAEILALGGNVVDAAVAVSFALSVVEPDASGIGGYGEMLIHREGMAQPTAIEFSTRLPAGATLDNPVIDALPRSGAAVAIVPGTVAGMELAWRQYGSGDVPWARLVEPAIRLAEDGYPISDGFATTLRRERLRFEGSPGAMALFFPDGEPLATGDTLRNPDQGWTLRQIAEHGADAFYRGEVARRMAAALGAGGNLMTLEDLANYTAVERRPVHTTYRGNDVFSGPPPITGGVQLAGRLNLLELAEPGTSITQDAATLHALIEAWKLQPGTGGRVGDPDIWPVDLTPFESKDTAAARWRCFDPRQASPPGAGSREDCGRPDGRTSPERGAPAASAPGVDGMASSPDGAPWQAATTSPEECLMYDRDCQGTGTTAFVVADADGNVVSVTQTLGTWGGNFHVTPGLGFLYNDKLRSYGGNPDAVNSRRPGARTTTIITPTIVFRGSGPARRAWFGVGAAGNAWISAAVYQAVAGIVDHGLTAQQALELPRILAGGRVMQMEQGFAPSVIRELEAMGHAFQPISLLGELRMGYGAAVLIGDGWVEAAADPRRSGHGAVVPDAAGRQ